jgi:hypothetical protein
MEASMPGKTQSHSDAVLDLVATAHYVALYSSAPPADDSGPGTELANNGYARKAITFGPKQTEADGHTRSFANASTILLGPAAAADWQTASHFGIVDAATAGTVKYTAALPTPKTVEVGDYAQFDIGTLIVKED